MERHNDSYGTCPRCEHIGWHKYKGKAIIFGDDGKYKVSLFKCPKCGKKFGFDLGGEIKVPNKLIERIVNGEKEDETYEINGEEICQIQDRLERMVNAMDNGYSHVDIMGIVLHNIAGIANILDQVTGHED